MQSTVVDLGRINARQPKGTPNDIDESASAVYDRSAGKQIDANATELLWQLLDQSVPERCF